MKRSLHFLFFLLFASIFAFNANGQLYEMEIRNFTQVSEFEIQWDVYIRKPSGTDWALDGAQFQITINTDMLNGGVFENAHLTLDATGTGIVGPIGTNLNSTEVTAISSGTIIQWVSSTSLSNGQTVTVFDNDAWKKIATFSAKNRKDGNFHPFASVDPQFGFRNDPSQLYTLVAETAYSGTLKDGLASVIPIGNRTLIPDHGVAVASNQIAGFWFTGDGNWSNAANWNQALKAEYAGYTQTVPDANANVVINGNVTIPSGDVSLIPSGGNGGELTILTGEEPLYTLNVTTNFPELGFTVRAREGISGTTTWMVSESASFSLQLPAGIQFRLYTYDRDEQDYTFNTWTASAGSFTNPTAATQAIFTMPDSNTNVVANWSPSKINHFDYFELDMIISEDNIFDQHENPGNTHKSGLFSSLTIGPGVALTVDKIFNYHDDGAAAIVLQSPTSHEPAGSLRHNNTGVQATVQRYIAATGGTWGAPGNTAGWHLVSSPVAAQAVSGAWTPDGLSDNNYDFYSWSEATQTWLNQKIGGNNINTFTPGRGYLIAYQAATTNAFAGELNAEDVVVGLTRSGADSFYGWNLVGNPFSSAILWGAAWGLPAGVGGVAKVWNEAGTSYVDRNDVDPIPAMNGFFVYLGAGATADLTIPAAARTHNAQAWYKENENRNRVKLIARDSERKTFQESIVRFNPEASPGFDLKYDAYFMAGYAPMLYSHTSDGMLSTNTLPELTNNLVVPMGFVKNNANEFVIELTETINNDRLTIWLHDSKTDITHNLTQNREYSFTSQQGDDPQRFELRFTKDVTNVGEIEQGNMGNAWMHDNALYVHSVHENTRVELYDISGRKINSFVSGIGQQAYPVDLPAGIYTVRMTAAGAVKSVKVVVR